MFYSTEVRPQQIQHEKLCSSLYALLMLTSMKGKLLTHKQGKISHLSACFACSFFSYWQFMRFLRKSWKTEFFILLTNNSFKCPIEGTLDEVQSLLYQVIFCRLPSRKTCVDRPSTKFFISILSLCPFWIADNNYKPISNFWWLTRGSSNKGTYFNSCPQFLCKTILWILW